MLYADRCNLVPNTFLRRVMRLPNLEFELYNNPPPSKKFDNPLLPKRTRTNPTNRDWQLLIFLISLPDKFRIFLLSRFLPPPVFTRCSPLVALACFGFAAGGLKSEPVISAASAEQQRPRARTHAHEKPGEGERRGSSARERAGWASSGGTWRTVGIRHMVRNFIRPRRWIYNARGTVANSPPPAISLLLRENFLASREEMKKKREF